MLPEPREAFSHRHQGNNRSHPSVIDYSNAAASGACHSWAESASAALAVPSELWRAWGARHATVTITLHCDCRLDVRECRLRRLRVENQLDWKSQTERGASLFHEDMPLTDRWVYLMQNSAQQRPAPACSGPCSCVRETGSYLTKGGRSGRPIPS